MEIRVTYLEERRINPGLFSRKRTAKFETEKVFDGGTDGLKEVINFLMNHEWVKLEKRYAVSDHWEEEYTYSLLSSYGIDCQNKGITQERARFEKLNSPAGQQEKFKHAVSFAIRDIADALKKNAPALIEEAAEKYINAD